MVYHGGTYAGQWRDDAQCGEGVMTWAASGDSYRGQWERGLPNGLGEHTWELDGGAPCGSITCLMPNRRAGVPGCMRARVPGARQSAADGGRMQPIAPAEHNTAVHAHRPHQAGPACSSAGMTIQLQLTRPQLAPACSHAPAGSEQVPRPVQRRPPPRRGRAAVRERRALRGHMGPRPQAWGGRVRV